MLYSKRTHSIQSAPADTVYGLQEMPASIYSLPSLRELVLRCVGLAVPDLWAKIRLSISPPAGVCVRLKIGAEGGLKTLKALTIKDCTRLKEISLAALDHLEALTIEGCALEEVCLSDGAFSRLHALRLDGSLVCGAFSESHRPLSRMRQLPACFGRLVHLKTLSIRDFCKLETLAGIYVHL